MIRGKYGEARGQNVAPRSACAGADFRPAYKGFFTQTAQVWLRNDEFGRHGASLEWGYE
jgi:hypothetical protein